VTSTMSGSGNFCTVGSPLYGSQTPRCGVGPTCTNGGSYPPLPFPPNPPPTPPSPPPSPAPSPPPCVDGFVTMNTYTEKCTSANSQGPTLSSDECLRYVGVLTAQGVAVTQLSPFVYNLPVVASGCIVLCGSDPANPPTNGCEADKPHEVLFNANAVDPSTDSHTLRVCRCSDTPSSS